MKIFLFVSLLLHFGLVGGHFELKWENKLSGKAFGSAALDNEKNILVIGFTKPEDVDLNEGAAGKYKPDICCTAQYNASKGNIICESYYKKIDPIKSKKFLISWKTSERYWFGGSCIHDDGLSTSLILKYEIDSILKIRYENKVFHESPISAKRVLIAKCPNLKITATATEEKISLRNIEEELVFQEIDVCKDSGLDKMLFFFENENGLYLCVVYEDKIQVYKYQVPQPLKSAKKYRNPLQ